MASTSILLLRVGEAEQGVVGLQKVGVTGEVEKVKLARLLCETSTTEALGEQSWSFADLQGVFDPQAASGSVSMKKTRLGC